MPHYALAGHVFVCLQGEHVVFLDVMKDRYFALEARQTASLGALVPGWPVETTPAASETPCEETRSSVIALLLERGILSADERDGKPATPVCVQPITSELSADAYPEATRASLASVASFATCAIRASLMLRFTGFARVVERVRLRNLRHASDGFDAAAAHRLVATFAALRPFFFTAKDMCLFEALALSELLAQHGLFPHWVFGVQARPFAAHCWLQHGAILLNDTFDHVQRYAPIMVV